MSDTNLYPFAKLANYAYDAPSVTADKIAEKVPGYTLLQQRGGLPILGGYNGLSAYNKATNTLVIASAGTRDLGDLANNVQYARGLVPVQVESAVALFKQSIAELKSQGFEKPQVVFVGHSLGGVVSNYAMRSIEGEAKVIAINSPGMYGPIAGLIGGALGFEDRDPNVTYVYSQFYFWSAPLHDSGLPRKERVIIVPGSFGHGIKDMLPYIEIMQDPKHITVEQYNLIKALERFDPVFLYQRQPISIFKTEGGDPVFVYNFGGGRKVNVYAFSNDDGTVQYELESLDKDGYIVGTEIIVGRVNITGAGGRFVPESKLFYDSEDNLISTKDLASGKYSHSGINRCFVAGTTILMADGSTKPIEAIRPGDEVAAFDPDAQQGLGPLRPGKVTRTFTNVTRTIINLRGLHMTPGHVVLMDNGEWDIIARALKDDRAIVEEREDSDGSSKATLVRARTGAALGSLEDTPITVVFADPATGRERHALVRAGIPVKARTLEDGNLELCTMADILTMQDYTIEPDGTILCRDGHRYEATPWADDDAPRDLFRRILDMIDDLRPREPAPC